MFGFEYRWLMLNPLVRGVALTLSLAALCVSCLSLHHSVQAVALGSTATVTASAGTVADDAQAVWPRAAVRLWLLVPQLLPAGSR